MPATAAQVHTTLLAALRALVNDPGPPSTAKPLAMATDITEPLTKDNIDVWTGSQFPCATLYWQQDRDDTDFISLGGGPAEVRSRERWIVYVGVEDPRDEGATMTGATGVPGALTLKGAVKSACNGLRVAAPPATLQFKAFGATNVTDAIDPKARVQFTVNGSLIEFSIVDTSVTWSSFDGSAILTGTCVTAGALGNLPQGLSSGIWNTYAPTHSSASPISVWSVQTVGQHGTLREKPIWFIETQPPISQRGAYYVIPMVFECEIEAEQFTAPDESRTLGPINGNIDIVDGNGNSLTFDTIRANTQT